VAARSYVPNAGRHTGLPLQENAPVRERTQMRRRFATSRIIAAVGVDRVGCRTFSLVCTMCRGGIALLVALAPLLCVAFCHLRYEIQWAEVRRDLHFLHNHRPASSGDERVPLGELQQLIRSVTECAPSAETWGAVASVVAGLIVLRAPSPRSAGLRPPIPPPRLLLAASLR